MNTLSAKRVVGFEIIFFEDNKDYPKFKHCQDATFLMQDTLGVKQIKEIAKTLSNGRVGSVQVCKLYAAGRSVCKRNLVFTDRTINLI